MGRTSNYQSFETFVGCDHWVQQSSKETASREATSESEFQAAVVVRNTCRLEKVKRSAHKEFHYLYCERYREQTRRLPTVPPAEKRVPDGTVKGGPVLFMMAVARAARAKSWVVKR